MDKRSGNILRFTGKQITEWPKSVYLADLGDGDGCRAYTHIQYPDQTTPEYVRYDLYFSAVHAGERAIRQMLNALPLLQYVLDDDALPRDQHDALTAVADMLSISAPIEMNPPPEKPGPTGSGGKDMT